MATRIASRRALTPDLGVATLAPRDHIDDTSPMASHAAGARVVSRKDAGTLLAIDPQRPRAPTTLRPPSDLQDARPWRPVVVPGGLVSLHEPSGTVWALDSITGQTMWRAKLAPPRKSSDPARTISAVRDGDVIALLVNRNDRDAALFVLDWRTGTLSWRKRVPDHSREFAANGKVYVYVPPTGELRAYGPDGKQLWTQPAAGHPQLWHAHLLANRDSVVLVTPEDVHVIDAEEGASCHRVATSDLGLDLSSNAWLYLSPAIDHARVFAYARTEADDGLAEATTYAVALDSGKVLWQEPTATLLPSRSESRLLVDADAVFTCAGQDGTLRALDPVDGTERWSFGVGSCDFMGATSPAGALSIVAAGRAGERSLVFSRGSQVVPAERAWLEGTVRDSKGAPYRSHRVLVHDQVTETDDTGRFSVHVLARGGVAVRVSPAPMEKGGNLWVPLSGRGRYRVALKTELARPIFD